MIVFFCRRKLEKFFAVNFSRIFFLKLSAKFSNPLLCLNFYREVLIIRAAPY